MTITNEQVAKTGKVEIAQLSRQKEGGGVQKGGEGMGRKVRIRALGKRSYSTKPQPPRRAVSTWVLW